MCYLPALLKIVVEKGGNIIDYNRTDILTARARFECSEGHEWETRIGRVLKENSWCRKCKAKKAGLNKVEFTLKDYHKKAKEYGGKFLSKKYVKSTHKYKWQCKNGHIFKATWGNVRHNKWCKQCQYLTIEQMNEYAEKRGGKCLSEKYVNIKTKLKWECKYGHQWEARASIINQNNWCPKCKDSMGETVCRKILEFLFKKPFPKKRPTWLKYKRNLELDCYNRELKIALEYNGAQHYNENTFFDNNLKERKEMDAFKVKKCAEKKIFLIVVPYTIKSNKLYTLIRNKCLPYLTRETPENIDICELEIKDPKTERLNELQKMAEEKGGTVISDRYINNTTKIKFCCKEGHEFKSTFSVVLSGSWCSKCAFNWFRNIGFEKSKEFAKENKGTLLSVDYDNAKKKLEWKCKNDHVFKRNIDNMKNRKNFCPECKDGIQKTNLLSLKF